MTQQEVTTAEMVRILERKARAMQPGSKVLTRALTRIALRFVAQVKANIRDRKMVDSGALFRSVKYEIESAQDSTTLRAGSFGLPYAAIHEFGGAFTPKMRAAMMANLRARGKTWEPKGVITGPPGDRRFPPRPYVGSAVKKEKEFIIRTIREALAGA